MLSECSLTHYTVNARIIMDSILPPYNNNKKESHRLADSRRRWKRMNFRVLHKHDKCAATLHMSVFNPEHTLHPPGHAVHMSGMGDNRLLPVSHTKLRRTHAWTDMVRVRRRSLFYVGKNVQPRQRLLALAAGSLCHLMWRCDIRGACAQTYVSRTQSTMPTAV